VVVLHEQVHVFAVRQMLRLVHSSHVDASVLREHSENTISEAPPSNPLVSMGDLVSCASWSNLRFLHDRTVRPTHPPQK